MLVRVPITEGVRFPVIEQADGNTQQFAEAELYLIEANKLCGRYFEHEMKHGQTRGIQNEIENSG